MRTVSHFWSNLENPKSSLLKADVGSASSDFRATELRGTVACHWLKYGQIDFSVTEMRVVNKSNVSIMPLFTDRSCCFQL